MPELIGHDVGVVFWLALFIWFLAFPFVSAWFVWRIARDLRRIADSTERQTGYLVDPPFGRVDEKPDTDLNGERRVSLSMFGR